MKKTYTKPVLADRGRIASVTAQNGAVITSPETKPI